MRTNYGPTLPISQELHAAKYRGEGESFYEAMTRIADALKDSDEHFRAFRAILLDQRFLPGGRVQAAMGAARVVTPYNCFVSGTIEDSMDSIMLRATEAAQTMRLGGGIGYDFSQLRPKGDRIRTLDSQSSGPVSFMHIFDAVCATIASAGHRRGAQMGVLRIDHPDIEAFIHAKNNSDRLTNFNISVGVTDEFMQCVEAGADFALRFDGRVYKTVKARALWDAIMRSTWDYAEPGVLFIDRINEMNNLYYCEKIAATNPCGEQPLPPYGACLLGSFNLVKYVRKDEPYRNGWCQTDIGYQSYFDWRQFNADIHHVVRAMDNVVDRAVYPLPQQEREAKIKRRMGLGVTGLANAGEVLGMPYGSPDFLRFTGSVLANLRNFAYLASVALAEEKGAFPAFSDEYLESRFIQTLPDHIQTAIAKHGIRNSHLTSIAPTGTISLSADNVSSGIEPVFSLEFDRTIQTPEGPRVETVQDYGYRVWGVRGKTADQCSADDHLNVLLTATKYIDSAVSKTCNVSPDMPWEEFKDLYLKAWRGGAKGLTTFNSGGKRKGILNAKPKSEEEAGAACYIDERGNKTCE